MPRPARHDGRRETGHGQDKEGPISDIVNPPLMGDSLLRNFKSGSHDHKELGFEAINRSSSGEDGEGSRRKTGKNVFFLAVNSPSSSSPSPAGLSIPNPVSKLCDLSPFLKVPRVELSLFLDTRWGIIGS